MPRRQFTQTDFSAGLMGARLQARTDLKKYQQGVSALVNMIPLKSGGITRRAGFEFIQNSGSSEFASRLIPFQFSNDESYVLEIFIEGNTKMRIYRDGEALNDADGNQIELDLTTPGYSNAALAELNFTQTADILYVFHRNYPIYRLKRTGLDNIPASWVWEEFEYSDGPYDPLNEDTTQKVQYVIPEESDTDYPGGTPGLEIGNTIKFTNTTGENIFENSTGRLFAMTIADEYDELNTPAQDSTLRRGVARILSETGTIAYGEVTVAFPDGGKQQSVPEWQFGGFTADTTGFPGTGLFHQQRLVLAGTNKSPNRIWLSKTDRFNDFGPTDPTDVSVVSEDLSIDATIADNKVNSIRGLTSDARGLIIHCEDGEFLMTASSVTGALSPTDLAVLRQGNYGIRPFCNPIQVGDRIVFAERDGNRVRELGFAFSSDRYQARDLTVFADNVAIGLGRKGFTQSCYQRGESNVCWFLRGDGVLASLTYERTEDVFAWALHKFDHRTGIEGEVESICVITENGVDRLYMTGEDSQGVRGVYRLGQSFTYTMGSNQIEMLECWERKNFAQETSSLTGLSRFANETITALVDGATVSLEVDGSGNATSDVAGKKFLIGRPYISKMETQPLQFLARFGREDDPRFAVVRLIKAFIWMFRSLGGEVEKGGKVVPLDYREVSDEMSDAPPIQFKQIQEVGTTSSSDRISTFVVRTSDPQPMTILGFGAVCDIGGST